MHVECHQKVTIVNMITDRAWNKDGYRKGMDKYCISVPIDKLLDMGVSVHLCILRVSQTWINMITNYKNMTCGE